MIYVEAIAGVAALIVVSSAALFLAALFVADLAVIRASYAEGVPPHPAHPGMRHGRRNLTASPLGQRLKRTAGIGSELFDDRAG